MSCFQAFNKNVTRLVKGKKLQKVLEAVLNGKQQFEETEQQSQTSIIRILNYQAKTSTLNLLDDNIDNLDDLGSTKDLLDTISEVWFMKG